MGRRREERICIELPVRIWGLDSLGKAFSASATTVDITRMGARLRGITVPLRPGEVIGVQHENEKARFRVAWVGRVGMNSGQIGVCCVEPGKYIWGKPLAALHRMAQDQAKAAVPPSATTVSAGSSGTAPGPSRIPVKPAPEPPSVVQKTDEGRRIAARFSCRGGAEIRDQSGNRLWGTVSDLSTTGCYVETFAPLAPGSQIQLNVAVQNTQIQAKAEVKTSHPTVGMGVSFVEMSAEDRDRLDRIIHQFTGDDSSPAEPTSSAPAVPPGSEDKLESLVHILTLELQQLDRMLASGAINLEPHLLAEFRNSAEMMRQTASVVQKWLQYEREKRDGFEVLEELETQRLGAATKMLRHLTLDVDSTTLQLSTPGMVELRDALNHLQRRLDKLTQSERGLSNFTGLKEKL